MILVLDTGGALTLYSGAARISRVMLAATGTTLLSHTLSQEISALALDSQPCLTPLRSSAATSRLCTPSSFHLDLGSAPSTPLNYKRSSLLTSSRPPSGVLPSFGNNSALGALSHVAGSEEDPPVSLTRLLDSTDSQVTLDYSTGRLVQVTLPAVGSLLVWTGSSS